MADVFETPGQNSKKDVKNSRSNESNSIETASTGVADSNTLVNDTRREMCIDRKIASELQNAFKGIDEEPYKTYAAPLRQGPRAWSEAEILASYGAQLAVDIRGKLMEDSSSPKAKEDLQKKIAEAVMDRLVQPRERADDVTDIRSRIFVAITAAFSPSEPALEAPSEADPSGAAHETPAAEAPETDPADAPEIDPADAEQDPAAGPDLTPEQQKLIRNISAVIKKFAPVSMSDEEKTKMADDLAAAIVTKGCISNPELMKPENAVALKIELEKELHEAEMLFFQATATTEGILEVLGSRVAGVSLDKSVAQQIAEQNVDLEATPGKALEVALRAYSGVMDEVIGRDDIPEEFAGTIQAQILEQLKEKGLDPAQFEKAVILLRDLRKGDAAAQAHARDNTLLMRFNGKPQPVERIISLRDPEKTDTVNFVLECLKPDAETEAPPAPEAEPITAQQLLERIAAEIWGRFKGGVPGVQAKFPGEKYDKELNDTVKGQLDEIRAFRNSRGVNATPESIARINGYIDGLVALLGD